MYLVTAIRQSEGGHKLSHEALEIVVFLAGDALLPAREEKNSAELLMDAHDYVWALTDHYPQHIRLEVCNLLFALASDCIERDIEHGVAQQRKLATLIQVPPKLADKKKPN